MTAEEAAAPMEHPASLLAIYLFGPFELYVGGAPSARFRFRKSPWLLALLALRGGAPVERSWLGGLLWPESTDTQALRNCLTDLRRALGPEAWRLRSPTARTLGLCLDGARVDLLAFDAALAGGDVRSLEEAVAFYRGPLLEGCEEEWAFQERQLRQQACLGALEALASAARARGNRGAAEEYLRRAVTVDPLRESVQRALIETLAAGGNYAAALHTYRELRGLLHRELNAEPDPETSALFQRVRAEAREKAVQGAQCAARGPGTPRSMLLAPRQGKGAYPRGARSTEPRAASEASAATLTFLFTDIEGSVELWERHPDAMRAALARHDDLLRQTIESRGGGVFKTVGDAFHAVFPTAPDAVAAALASQQALRCEPWGEIGALRVRMALHSGIAEARGGDYFGATVNRVARLLQAGHGGQVLLSAASQELVRDHLPEQADLRELGACRLKDLARPERVYQLLHPELDGEFPPLRGLDARPHNLPVQPTPLIGREQELASLRELLGRAGARLVTLTGPGGTGKTRLALQVAADLLDTFADGVYFVDLAPIRDVGLVVPTIAQALGMRESGGRPVLESLKSYLQDKRLLLVLDNFEQVLEAAPAVAELLGSAASLKVLVTSRAVLGVRGEQQFPVPPLAVPDPRRLPPVEALSQYAAVELFIQRAASARPGFAVTNETAPAIAEICYRLDGLPLAIELAAARVNLFAPEALLARLESRLTLLTGGPRDAPARQQTLRDAIGWSYDLLPEAEQRLFRQLAVFAGGFTLEAAEAVCGEAVVGSRFALLGHDDEPPQPTTNNQQPTTPCAILDGIASLVEKSLLRQTEGVGGEPRFGMLETIREFAGERLAASGETAAALQRHAACFLELVEREEARLLVRTTRDPVDRLDAEHDNLRAALDHLAATEQIEAGLRIAGALSAALESGFWICRGPWQEGLQRLILLLESPACRAGRVSPPVLAKALRGAGHLATGLGESENDRALSFLEESVRIARTLPERLELARSLLILGKHLGRNRKEIAPARAALEESIALFEQLSEPAGLVLATCWLARTFIHSGEPEQARTLCDRVEPLCHALDDLACRAFFSETAGHIARSLEEYDAAARHYAATLVAGQELDDQWSIATSLVNLANLACHLGDTARATELLHQALAAQGRLGWQDAAAHTHRWLAELTDS